MGKFKEWINEGWGNLSPDSAMHSFGEASKFTAFIWVLDKKSGKSLLYCQPGSQYHGGAETVLKKANTLKHTAGGDYQGVACFGRFGQVEKPGEFSRHDVEGGFVTVWNINEDEVETDFDKEYKKEGNRGFIPPNKDEVKVLLKGLLGESPMKVMGESPAKIPITREYMFVVRGQQQTVGDYIGEKQAAADPCLKAMQINVQGRMLPLSDVQAQLHMVKGQQLELLRGSYCSQYQGLKKSPESQQCPYQVRQLDDLANQFKCGNDQQLYQTLKQTGKADYKARLRDIFRDPAKVDQEFRGNQKAIDAAWDYLQRDHFSFRGWMEVAAVLDRS